MKILLVENTSKDFFGSRVRYGQFLQDKGHTVEVLVPGDSPEYPRSIENAGLKVHSFEGEIRGFGIWSKLRFIILLFRLVQSEQYDVLHTYRLQPNILAGIVGIFFSDLKVVNHVTGLGIAFSNETAFNKLLQIVTRSFYNFNLRVVGVHMICQNQEDAEMFVPSRKKFVIPGSAVNEDKFRLIGLEERLSVEQGVDSSGELKVLFVSRLLRSKGVRELYESVQILAKQGLSIHLTIVCKADDSNSDSLTEEMLKEMRESPFASVLGERSDIAELIHAHDFCALPTYYREGTPRFLLEAMACGKPISTTNMPGCNHLIKDNGILVEARSVSSIVEGILAMPQIIQNQAGSKSRELYELKFCEDVVYNSILSVYQLNVADVKA